MATMKLREAQEVRLLFHAADSSLEDSRLSGQDSPQAEPGGARCADENSDSEAKRAADAAGRGPPTVPDCVRGV